MVGGRQVRRLPAARQLAPVPRRQPGTGRLARADHPAWSEPGVVDRVHRTVFEAMASHCEIRIATPDPQVAAILAQQAVAEVRRAWDFRHAQVPSPEVLTPLLALVGWRRVQRDGDRVHLPQAGMEIDFGGFGKEYAADRAATLLTELGVWHGYVNLGGDMRFIGPQPDGEPWMIGIQDPRDPEGSVASIPVSQGALATSGDYERYFDLDGQRYCHILDPRSGMPVSHWRSVSVLAPLAIAAGSCATIAMLKQADGLDFLEQSGMSYLAIDHTGRMRHRRT